MQRRALVVFSIGLLCVWVPSELYAYAPETLARAIRALIPETPLMVEVARCESGLRQFDAAGRPLRGGLGGAMIGLFQFHETYHRSAALALGYNLDTLLGNIAYARVLYRSQGITPWESSRHCWEPEMRKEENRESSTLENQETGKLENVDARTVGNQETKKRENQEISETQKLTKTLRFGTTDPEVRVLQTLLRSAGYPATAPGAETNYFGVATYKALLAFQCAKSIACLGNPSMKSGVGVVDERTRSALRS